MLYVINLNVTDETGEVLNQSFKRFEKLEEALSFFKVLSEFQPCFEVEKRLGNIRVELHTIIE
jgi:hypothetical protein